MRGKYEHGGLNYQEMNHKIYPPLLFGLNINTAQIISVFAGFGRSARY
jgi:hypothetical protein